MLEILGGAPSTKVTYVSSWLRFVRSRAAKRTGYDGKHHATAALMKYFVSQKRKGKSPSVVKGAMLVARAFAAADGKKDCVGTKGSSLHQVLRNWERQWKNPEAEHHGTARGALSWAQVNLLWDKPPRHTTKRVWRAFISLCWLGVMRPGEALKCKPDHIEGWGKGKQPDSFHHVNIRFPSQKVQNLTKVPKVAILPGAWWHQDSRMSQALQQWSEDMGAVGEGEDASTERCLKSVLTQGVASAHIRATCQTVEAGYTLDSHSLRKGAMQYAADALHFSKPVICDMSRHEGSGAYSVYTRAPGNGCVE